MRVNELRVLIGRHYCAGADTMMTHYQLAPRNKHQRNLNQNANQIDFKNFSWIVTSHCWPSSLTHCGLVTPYGDIALARHRFKHYIYSNVITSSMHSVSLSWVQFSRKYSWYQSPRGQWVNQIINLAIRTRQFDVHVVKVTLITFFRRPTLRVSTVYCLHKGWYFHEKTNPPQSHRSTDCQPHDQWKI